jgi:Flp pilus assembly secretin CpaC
VNVAGGGSPIINPGLIKRTESTTVNVAGGGSPIINPGLIKRA